MRNIFLKKSCTKHGRENFLRRFFKKSDLVCRLVDAKFFSSKFCEISEKTFRYTAPLGAVCASLQKTGLHNVETPS